jgi:glycerate 2-kinase
MNPEQLLTHSLRESQHGTIISQILSAALAAVDPAAAIRNSMQRQGNMLSIGQQTYDLTHYERVLLIGMGKAGTPMALASAEILGDALHQGIIVVKEGHGAQTELPERLRILEAGHPIPDQRGVDGAQQIADLLSTTTAKDLVIALISGGGSALLTLPIEGISLADLQALTKELLACGATINEINTLRKHLDRVKGGGLARLAQPAQLATLILSDVVGNPLDVIASGPTVPDTSTFAEAYAILEHYQVLDQVPAAIVQHLHAGKAGEIADTPKQGDPLFDKVQNLVIASNIHAADAALACAQQHGLNTLLLTSYLQGEAREVSRVFSAIAREIADTARPLARPACIVAGGETTVTIRGKGKGGRNQELALAGVSELGQLENIWLITLATDGGDGPTDAAGAVVNGQTLARARALGLEPAEYLARNDAYHFFQQLDDLLLPGPTHTNVNDLTFVFAF